MGGAAHGGKRVSRAEAGGILQTVGDFLRQSPNVRQVILAGSLGRGEEEGGDVDLVVETAGPIDVVQRLLFGTLKNGKPAKSGLLDGVQVDLFITDADGLGAATLHAMGPVQRNISMRSKARAKGMLLNEKGLWNKASGQRLAVSGAEIERMVAE